MKRLTALTLILTLFLSLLAGCNVGGASNTLPSDNAAINGSENTMGTEPTVPGGDDTTDPTVPGGDDITDPTVPGGDDTTDPTIPGGDDTTDPTVPGGDDTTDPTIPGGDDTTDPTVPGGDDTTDPTIPGGDDTTDPTVPGGDDEEDKEVVLPGEGIPIENPEDAEELSDDYLYPPLSITEFTKNNKGIYENAYVKLDATHATQGYLLVTYKEPYATEVGIYMDENNALSENYEKTHIFIYKKGSYTVGEEIVVKLPTPEALYYVCVASTINGVDADKMYINLGLVVAEGTVSLDHIMPSEEKIQLTEVANGIYENGYVRINTNTANKGYIEVQSLDPDAESIRVVMHADVQDARLGYGQWHYNSNQKGKSTLKAALTYGNATYEIDIWTTLSSKVLGITRSTRKARLTVTLNNVSDTGGFLLSTGEVVYSSSMQFIKKADEIAATCSNDFEKVSKIYAWLTSYLDYEIADEGTALGIYKCNLDKVYERGYGACYDYAVILAAMLRSQGIPCKVVFGRYTDSDYGHVWNEIYIDSNGSITTDKVDIGGNRWCRLDPTMSHTNSGKHSTDYMNTDRNYVCEFIY